jgi:AcrR family transcriptional regulator
MSHRVDFPAVAVTAHRARQREQRADTRQTILAAADRLLRERPFRELSVEALMTQTGLTRTAFYRHFDDVTDVVLRVLQEVGGELMDVAGRWNAEVGIDTPGPAREALAATVEFFVRHGPLVRAVAEAASSDERIEAAYQATLDRFVELTVDGFDRLAAEGRLQVADTRSLARALTLMNQAYLLDTFGHTPGDPELALTTLETIWLGVVGAR